MTFDQAFFFLFLLLFSGKRDAWSQVIAWVSIYFGKQQIDPAQFAYGQRKERRKADNIVQYSREYIYLIFCYDISKGTAFRLQGLTYKWRGQAKWRTAFTIL